MFLSEEKNQKTFFLMRLRNHVPRPQPFRQQGAKVFWFFSSEKNITSSFGGRMSAGRQSLNAVAMRSFSTAPCKCVQDEKSMTDSGFTNDTGQPFPARLYTCIL
jgi:hypothetical protein